MDIPRGLQVPKISSPRTYFSEVSRRQRSFGDRVRGGERWTLKRVLVLDKILLDPRKLRSLEGGRASRVCIVTATSMLNCTGSLHVSTTRAQVSRRRTR